MSLSTHMNESWHTHEGVWHTYEWVMAHISWHTYAWVLAHTWMSHGTRMNESWHTYEWVMVHIYEWVMAHIWMSHGAQMTRAKPETRNNAATLSFVGTHMNQSWHTHEWVWTNTATLWVTAQYEWVMAYTCMSHGTHMNESWYTGDHSKTRDTNQRGDAHRLLPRAWEGLDGGGGVGAVWIWKCVPVLDVSGRLFWHGDISPVAHRCSARYVWGTAS